MPAKLTAETIVDGRLLQANPSTSPSLRPTNFNDENYIKAVLIGLRSAMR